MKKLILKSEEIFDGKIFKARQKNQFVKKEGRREGGRNIHHDRKQRR
jgi:hypothetical protein